MTSSKNFRHKLIVQSNYTIITHFAWFLGEFQFCTLLTSSPYIKHICKSTFESVKVIKKSLDRIFWPIYATKYPHYTYYIYIYMHYIYKTKKSLTHIYVYLYIIYIYKYIYIIIYNIYNNIVIYISYIYICIYICRTDNLYLFSTQGSMLPIFS